MGRSGIIGLGFMGMTHFEGAMRMSDADESGRRGVVGPRINGGQITAFATRNAEKRSGDWTAIQGNFGPPGTLMDLEGVTAYSDYHDLLSDPNIDLVDICLPTDKHEQVALEALAAGKHLLVEKPIEVDLDAARRMVAAAAEAGEELDDIDAATAEKLKSAMQQLGARMDAMESKLAMEREHEEAKLKEILRVTEVLQESPMAV